MVLRIEELVPRGTILLSLCTVATKSHQLMTSVIQHGDTWAEICGTRW